MNLDNTASLVWVKMQSEEPADSRRKDRTLIEIAPGVDVSEHELSFTFDRSSGPGGQNVNKVNTRVTLTFPVRDSLSLSRQQKSQVMEHLGSRITQEGMLRIVSSKERTQLANRRAALSRFVELMSEAFQPEKERKETQPPASVDRKRLEGKRRRSVIKRSRAEVTQDAE